jgi:hypothetical protein
VIMAVPPLLCAVLVARPLGSATHGGFAIEPCAFLR